MKIDLLNGHIQKRRVRCGKANCKCVKGFFHTAYYHIWHTDGQRYQKYIRLCNVEEMRAACEQYRNLQIKLRAGRAEYKQLIARARELFRSIS